MSDEHREFETPLVDQIDFAMTALAEEGGIDLFAADADELLSRIHDGDRTAQHLRELARLIDLCHPSAAQVAA